MTLLRILAASVLVFCFAADSDAFLVRTFTTSSEVNQNPDANDVLAGGTVDVWTLDTGGAGPANAGSFVGNSASNANGSAAGAGDPAWGLYANSGQTSTASANVTGLMGRSLFLAGDSISLSFDNGFIDSGRSAGVRFFDSSGAQVSQLDFTGGGTNSYFLVDNAVTQTGVGFTGDGFDLTLTLDSSTGDYTFEFANQTFAARTLAANATNIARIDVFNESAGGDGRFDVYFNNLSITAVPEFSSAMIAAPVVFGMLAGLRRSSRR
ncbi:MAG: hypothetical protein AAGJ46_10210 [Planctomycetota bacterium]